MVHSDLSQPGMFTAVITVLGLIVGSFLATIVVRLPMGKSIVFGRSYCDDCGTQLRPWQLIPLVGWLYQGGRCHFCKEPISQLYPVMELCSAVVCLWSLAVVPQGVLLPTLVLGWLLLTLAAMDFRYLLLSDALTFSLLGLGFVTTSVLAPLSLFDHALGALGGAASLYGVNAFYRITRRRDGLGLGDVKLAGAAGAWLGWQGLPSVFVLASGVALIVLLVHRIFGAMINWDMKVAFGSYLCLGAWIVWLYGPITWGRG